MTRALFADIYANTPALEAVLSAARHADVVKLIIAGDIVGYCYAARRVIELLDEWDWVGLCGNHEDMLDQLDVSSADIRRRYGCGLAVARDELGANIRQRLRALPHPVELTIFGRTAVVCHGALWDSDTYIYPDAAPELRTGMADAASGADLLVFGHTHYPVTLREQRPRGRSLFVINPGSVGQPRDPKPGACFAVWSPEADIIEAVRVPYDPSAVIKECQRRDPQNTYLVDMRTRRG